MKREWQSRAEDLIREETGHSGFLRWQALHGDGSVRTFYRVASRSGTLILLWSPPEDDRFPNENDSYVYMGRHLSNKGIPVPRIHAYGRSEGFILLEDLGSVHLQDAVISAGEQLANLYQRAAALLLKVQVHATEDLDTRYCFDSPVYDPPFIMEKELAYFYRSFLVETLGLRVSWNQLEGDFLLLAARAGDTSEELFFLHRDFQSRNIMLEGEVLHLIDFQGARLGPPQYDLAALLADPYVQLPRSLQAQLLAAHAKRLSERVGISAKKFLEKYPHVALCRALQVLAAYAFLSRVRRKPHFARYIVPTWRRLRQQLAESPCSDYHVLARLVKNQSDQHIAEVAGRLARVSPETDQER